MIEENEPVWTNSSAWHARSRLEIKRDLSRVSVDACVIT